MRTCISFITVNTAINKVNVALLQHETTACTAIAKVSTRIAVQMQISHVGLEQGEN